MDKQWRVEIRGLVRRLVNYKRIPVSHGFYILRETGEVMYELSRETGATFELTLDELAQYVENGDLTFPDNDWP